MSDTEHDGKPTTKLAKRLSRKSAQDPDKPPIKTVVHPTRVSPLPIPARTVPRFARSHGFNPDYLMPIRLMLQGGATDNEIADALGITVDILYGWKRRNEELERMMRDSKEGYDLRIERSLAREAVGYIVRGEKIFLSGGTVHRVQYDEYVRPSVPAMIFWLKNRKRDEWQDRRIVDMPLPDNPQEAEAPADETQLAMAILSVLQEAMRNAGQTPVIDLPSIGAISDQTNQRAERAGPRRGAGAGLDDPGSGRGAGAGDPGERQGQESADRGHRDARGQGRAQSDDGEPAQAADAASGGASQGDAEAPGRERTREPVATSHGQDRSRERRRRAFDARHSYGSRDDFDLD